VEDGEQVVQTRGDFNREIHEIHERFGSRGRSPHRKTKTAAGFLPPPCAFENVTSSRRRNQIARGIAPASP
jgi:hypothetical protein